MRELSSNQDKILYQIKRLGPQPAKSLALHLGITTMAIRQHLATLESNDLIKAMEPELQSRGRPLTRWKLSSEGHARFPDAHAQVTAELISGIRDLLGDEALNKVIEQRALKSYHQYQQALAKRKGLLPQLRELAKLRTDEGYMAEVEKVADGEYLLVEQHCPICIAATSCQGFCKSEIDTFRRLFNGVASVERQEYLLDGARRCTYLITANR
jgi:predicted ArsR family transcriptional regulator